ncbi:MAG: GGDEF domain-containing protein [Anaerovoracaceae bacterium]
MFITKNSLINPDSRERVQLLLISCIIGVIFVCVFAINITHEEFEMARLTGSLAIICAINVLVNFITDKYARIMEILFGCCLVFIFSLFLVIGGPGGIAPFWMMLLPVMGFLCFGITKGALFCGLQLIIATCLVWTKSGSTMLSYEYSNSFILRFPVMFSAFCMLGILLEVIRSTIEKELIKTQQMYRNKSRIDPLTGLFNRLVFDEKIERVVFQKENRPIGILMLDIDDFKKVNDTYGHHAGDIVLTEIAEILGTCIENPELVSRWGGEEFTVLFEKITRDEIEAEAEGIRNKIESHKFSIARDQSLAITVSIGIAWIEGIRDITVETLFAIADKGLYDAKNSGKNCVKFGKM